MLFSDIEKEKKAEEVVRGGKTCVVLLNFEISQVEHIYTIMITFNCYLQREKREKKGPQLGT